MSFIISISTSKEDKGIKSTFVFFRPFWFFSDIALMLSRWKFFEGEDILAFARRAKDSSSSLWLWWDIWKQVVVNKSNHPWIAHFGAEKDHEEPWLVENKQVSHCEHPIFERSLPWHVYDVPDREQQSILSISQSVNQPTNQPDSQTIRTSLNIGFELSRQSSVEYWW